MPLQKKFHIKVEIEPDVILKRLVNYIASNKGNLLDATEKKITWSMGSSLKTRFFGGISVSEKTLPVKVELTIWKTQNYSEIEVSLIDNLGFGSRVGIKTKYERYLTSLYSEILSVLN